MSGGPYLTLLYSRLPLNFAHIRRRPDTRELAIIEVFSIHSHPAIVLLLETMLADHVGRAAPCLTATSAGPPPPVGVQVPIVKVSRVSPLCRGMSPTCRGRVAVCRTSVAGGSAPALAWACDVYTSIDGGGN